MAEPLSVLPVRDASEIRRFVDVAYHVHRDDDRWVPPLRADATARVRFRRNPFWRRADGRLFIARRRQRMVGRISVHLDAAVGGDRTTALFGFFECEDDPQAASALIAAARGFAADQGATSMAGPASFTAADEVGVLVEGYDAPASFVSPWHPPRYHALLEAAGGQPLDELVTVRIPAADQGAPGRRRDAEASPVEQRVSRVRRAVLELTGSLTTLAPDSPVTWLPTEREVRARLRRLEPLFDRRLLVVDETPAGVRGVAVVVPDLSEMLSGLGDGPGPARTARLLARARRTPECAAVAMLAGDPTELLPAALTRVARAGYRYLEVSAPPDSAAAHVAASRGGRVSRRYRTYRIPVPGR